MSVSRRRFIASTVRATTVSAIGVGAVGAVAAAGKEFQLNYILGSPMYGTTPLADIIAEAPKIGANYVDVWPRNHADHREQMDKLGHDQVEVMLDKHNVKLGMMTRYDLGPFRLTNEMPILQRFGGKLLVCGAKEVGGSTLKERVTKFVEHLKPHVERAAKHGLKLGIENHGGSLLSSPDSIEYFSEIVKGKKLDSHLGLAMAPYHLPQDPKLIASLIESLDRCLAFFQAWQHGNGCMKKLPKEQELLQLPGRGRLDFAPILAALRKIQYSGWTEIFMHPVPRGIPIHESTEEVTVEINRSRSYLADCLSA